MGTPSCEEAPRLHVCAFSACHCQSGFCLVVFSPCLAGCTHNLECTTLSDHQPVASLISLAQQAAPLRCITRLLATPAVGVPAAACGCTAVQLTASPFQHVALHQPMATFCCQIDSGLHQPGWTANARQRCLHDIRFCFFPFCCPAHSASSMCQAYHISACM